jgi:ketosteroid isomerase-like protein
VREPKAIVAEFFDALSRYDTTTMARLVDADIAWWGAKQDSPNRPVVGSDDVVALLSGGRGLFRPDSTSWTVFRLAEEDGTVIAHVQRHSLTAAGNDYDNECMWRFDVADGRITAAWEYTDTLYARATLARS